ncbi:MAG TPA: GLPGLI family protein [Hanamia sp.]
MKPSLIIACFCCLHISVSGQDTGKKKVIDSAFLRCYYVFSKTKPGDKKAFRSDTMVLDIGTKASRFYDPARLGRDSMLNARMKNMDPQTIKSINVLKGEFAKDLSNMPGTISSEAAEGESYQVIKDKATHNITVLDYVNAIGDRFKYEDETGVLPWQISGITDTVSSYSCQKATLNFRGRDYVAWFTTDIPVSDGPWKFSGLPGLILKMEDTQGLFVFKLIGLQQLSPRLPIQIDDSKSIKCSRADFEKLKRKQGAGMQININAGNVIIAETPGKVDYIQMELK